VPAGGVIAGDDGFGLGIWLLPQMSQGCARGFDRFECSLPIECDVLENGITSAVAWQGVVGVGPSADLH
jgi:hypothetical protein